MNHYGAIAIALHDNLHGNNNYYDDRCRLPLQ